MKKVVNLQGRASAMSAGYATPTIFERPPDDHPLYALIGRVASEWAYMEHRLDEIIWSLSGGSSAMMACITAQMMGHAPRYNAIIALLTYLRMDQALIKQARSQSGKVSELAEKRNRVVHDAWYVEVGKAEPHRYKSMSKSELEYGVSPHSEKEIQDLIAKIVRRIEDISQLAGQVTAARRT